MYSHLIVVSKIKSEALLEIQTFNSNQFFTFHHFSGFCIRQKKQEILVF